MYTEKAIEGVAAAAGVPTNGHATVDSSKAASKKKPTKRSGNGNGHDVPEVGQDELLGERQPGDAVTAD